MSIASLPMYDLPEVASANDSFWAAMARALEREGVTDVPTGLERKMSLSDQWRSPELLMSQTCGYPLMHEYAGRLSLVATPVYEVPGCEGPNYSSLILVRRDDAAQRLSDLRGRRAVVNHSASQSGYAALRASVAPLAEGGRFFGSVLESGGHPNSLAMVVGGEADVCAADCVTFALFARHRPEAVENLREIGRTPAAPGLPYITRPDAGEELIARLRAALFSALEAPETRAACQALFLAGAEVLPLGDYQRIMDMEQESEALGYAKVA
jgi:ABC-type phosphate/phosphonate transport system substrate-binding protein